MVTSPTVIPTLAYYVRKIMAACKTNPNFPDLNFPVPVTPNPNVPNYTQMETAVKDLEDQAIKYDLTRTPGDKTLRESKKAVLVAAVDGYVPIWANYVQTMCGSDLLKMQGSGFDLTGQPVPITALEQPQGLKVVKYEKFMFRLSVNPDEDATGIQWKVQQVDGTTKQPIPGAEPKTPISTASVVDVEGLVSGAWYAISCHSFASEGVVSTESDTIYRVCL